MTADLFDALIYMAWPWIIEEVQPSADSETATKNIVPYLS